MNLLLTTQVCICILHRMNLPSAVEMQLLALVAVRERAGREVARLYRDESGRSISYGTLYTTFRRLKDSRWVTTRDDQSVDGRVRYFRITAKGAAALQAAREHHVALANFGLQARGATS